jgi:hypothetical protein
MQAFSGHNHVFSHGAIPFQTDSAERGTHGTQDSLPQFAVKALAADLSGFAGDFVPRTEIPFATSCVLYHLSREFVAQGQGEIVGQKFVTPGPLIDMNIAPANTHSFNPDKKFPWLRPGNSDLHQSYARRRFGLNNRFHLSLFLRFKEGAVNFRIITMKTSSGTGSAISLAARKAPMALESLIATTAVGGDLMESNFFMPLYVLSCGKSISKTRSFSKGRPFFYSALRYGEPFNTIFRNHGFIEKSNVPKL